MNIFKITEQFHSQYHGSGYGMVATVDNNIVEIIYFTDISPEFFIESKDQLEKLISNPIIGEAAKKLNLKGNVHVGIFSNYEFIEL